MQDLVRQRREVLDLLHAGFISKAMNRVTSHGLGDPSDPAIQQQLAAKFPAGLRPLPDSVTKCNPID